jgi:hypothetical protein
MPGTPGILTLEFEPFPAELAEPAAGEGRAAFTVFESFAKEETVVLVDVRPGWSGDEPPAVVFDVVAAYPEDPHSANPSTSLSSIRVPHGTSRRFLVGIPGGHKLVLYPESAEWKPSGSSATGRLSVTVVDYWA